MKAKSISVELKLDDGQVLPEVRHNGTTYVVASPGKTFQVVVTSHQPANSTVEVHLRVDGVSAGSTLLLSGSRKGSFEGILTKALATGEGNMKRFQFAAATGLPDDGPAQNLDFAVGKITVRAVQVVKGERIHRVSDWNGKGDSAKLPTLNEGKKWFLAPSLQASNGPLTATKVDWSRYHWRKVAELETVSLRYETASILQLRKILDPSRPDHKRLIDDCLQQEAEDAAARHPQVVASRSGSAPNVVDLTQGFLVPVKEEPNIAKRMGLAQDEIAACDLTGDDDSPPVWQAVKKQRIAID